MHTAQLIKALRVDPALPQPLYRQLHEAVRRAIAAGTLKPGMQLPPTREFCELLQISRQTVLNAYDLLVAEGYLSGAVGRGTFVSEHVPTAAKPSNSRTVPALPPRPLSLRGRRLTEACAGTTPHQTAPVAFRHGIPGIDLFPFDVWSRLESRRWRKSASMLGYAEAEGFGPLREMIADYLRASRGVKCTAEQVIVTTGSQQSLYLAASMLLAPGDVAWMEDPGYPDARAIFAALDARAAPVPVDAEGLCIDVGRACYPGARLACVSPSHQYPLGGAMSLRRRLELLAWAEESGAWIVEDDYDSEYRYAGPPLASLQSLDKSGCVIYIGTFSKILFPGLRLGYLVVPEALSEAFARGKAVIDRHTPLVPQMTLSDFIAEGHFNRHLRRTRIAYAERRATLLAALGRHFGDEIAIGPSDTGLHVSIALARRQDDRSVADDAMRAGVEVRALSSYHAPDEWVRHSRMPVSGLLLGFAGVPCVDIDKAVATLQKACSGTSARRLP